MKVRRYKIIILKGNMIHISKFQNKEMNSLKFTTPFTPIKTNLQKKLIFKKMEIKASEDDKDENHFKTKMSLMWRS